MSDEPARSSGEQVFKVGGIHCANCPGLIEDRLKQVRGIERVSVSYPSERAVIAYAGELGVGALGKAPAPDLPHDQAEPVLGLLLQCRSDPACGARMAEPDDSRRSNGDFEPERGRQ